MCVSVHENRREDENVGASYGPAGAVCASVMAALYPPEGLLTRHWLEAHTHIQALQLQTQQKPLTRTHIVFITRSCN